MNKIEKFLIDNGFDPALKGFEYTVYAVKLIQKDTKYKNEICNLLYREVAVHFNDTIMRTQRAIKTLIDSNKNTNKLLNGLSVTVARVLSVIALSTKGDKDESR